MERSSNPSALVAEVWGSGEKINQTCNLLECLVHDVHALHSLEVWMPVDTTK